MAKIGRNQPCPCGSGKKFKRCCGALANTTVPARPSGVVSGSVPWEAVRIRAARKVAEMEAKRKAYEAAHGKGREMVTIEHQDFRFVAVGNEMHFAKAEKTKFFPDFLNNYVKTQLGSDWGAAQLNKPLQERHQILQWYDSLCRYQQKLAPEAAALPCVGTDWRTTCT
jgi:hypothetical protein